MSISPDGYYVSIMYLPILGDPALCSWTSVLPTKQQYQKNDTRLYLTDINEM